ncbi:protein THALLO isoform X1 [Cryptomeria japonica]|uniref:protein THALLO isoform X1 n=2 Tax=Cryptomeria japonica TaxID=3369 RepID=UPI0027D9F216|nr:protein THALLO isoform X1 [Cryptomeria japonica]XP_057854949.2 protein THALLO isoform X1 [Cryptomeria japonica]XP_057854950.2 protein THALLO isoform X1 [Cryptomeria japonica]XP_057854951.2 protein THALLO isoform X1 [Cryptomeria japonica]
MGRGKNKQKQQFIGKKGKNREEKSQGEHHTKMFSEEDMDDEVDVFHKQKDKIPLDLNEDDDTSDEEMEQPVFDLQGETSEEMEESDSEDEEQLTGLAAKIARQAKFLRQKAGGVEDEMDEEPAEEEEERKAIWGKGKKSYYNADNVDFEIQSSDEELPAEEEAEVLRLQRKKAESLRPEDFGIDEDDEDASDSDSDAHEETLQEAVKRQERGHGRKKLKEPSSGDPGKQVDDDKIVTFEEVKKDINALSKEQQMEVVMSDAPELVGLLSEFQDGLDQLRNVQPLLQKIKANKNATKEGLNYLEVKQLVLLCYCQSIVFYLLLKAEGHSVRDHPVIARLVEMRNILDKIRPIDTMLGNQIERFLEEDNSVLVESATTNAVMNSVLVDGVLPDMKTVSSGVKSSTDETIQVQVYEDKSELLNGPTTTENNMKITSNDNKEAKETFAAESKEMLKERAKLEAYMKQLKDGLSKVLPKHGKKNHKHLKRSRNGLLDTLEDFDDDVADLTTRKEDKSNLDSLQQPRKLSQLVAEAGRTKKPKLVSGDDDLPEKEDLGERRRRHETLSYGKSPSPDDVSKKTENDDLEGSEDEFYREVKQQRAAKLAAKEETYSRKPTIVAPEEELDGKRHITYQMEKNKGLTPHRKKLTKNPRKKYKLKHEKAVIRRKGQVRDIRKPQGPYGGETTGIRTGLSRSVRFKN